MSKEYRRLLEKTIIPDNYTAQNEKDCFELIDYINSAMPITLYRFRSVSERSLDAFLNDKLWFSNGSLMNDDFDSRIFYNKERIKKQMNSLVSDTGGLKPIDAVLNLKSIPDLFEQIIPNAKEEFERIKQFNKVEIDSLSKQIMQFIMDNIDVALDELTTFIQQTSKFACFTTDIKSNTMWGQYAGSSTGFALEYSFFEQRIKFVNMEYPNGGIDGELYPVEYYQKRLDATEFAVYLFQVMIFHKLAVNKGISVSDRLRNIIIPCPDSFMFTKIALAKSNEWCREKEWRMFFHSSIKELNDQKCSYVIYKPSALYLGKRISFFNQKILTDIAKEKGIPVYKMEFNDKSSTYKLKSIRIA